ncbi:MAG: S16 family serine protease [Myxococcota bacterium]
MRRAHLELVCSHVGALGVGVQAELARLRVAIPLARVGDPLILAATGTEGSLWRLARPGDERSVELSEHARSAWSLAGRVAARALPVVADPSALAPLPPPRLTALRPLSDVRDVDGPSVGLAFALLHLSRAAGVPIAEDLAATAEITPDGRLHPVGLLPEKLDALRRWAPGVQRVLVAERQVVPAHPGVTIVPVADLAEAWAVAFVEPGFDAGLVAAWKADPRGAAEAASGFYRLVLREPFSPLRWGAVKRATAELETCVQQGEDLWRTKVANAIASRHDGEPLLLPELPVGFRPRRPHRLQLSAHRVQAHNDAVEPGWRQVAEEALADVALPGEEHPGDLKVLGAVGRLYAAWGEWDAAAPLLTRAIDAWFDLEEPAEASYPICELVRIGGLSGDATRLGHAVRQAARCADHPRTSEHARTFLQLAIGRAYAVRGDSALALEALAAGAALWDETYVHVKASRLRLLARVTGGPLEALKALSLVDGDGLFSYQLALADRGDESGLVEMSAQDRRVLDRCARISADRKLDLFPY